MPNATATALATAPLATAAAAGAARQGSRARRPADGHGPGHPRSFHGVPSASCRRSCQGNAGFGVGAVDGEENKVHFGKGR